MPTVLLTGAGGFVGSHVFAHLMQNTELDAVVVDSFRHRGKTDRLAEMLEDHPEWRPRLRVVTHDLAAPLSTQLVDRIGPVQSVLNLAAESHVERSITDPVSFIRNNVDLTLNMLEYARQAKPDVFVQFSTDEVYGPMLDDVPAVEWSSIQPSNPYSASKAAQEAIAFSYWRTYQVPVVITNTMNIFGERQDPEKFIPQVIARVVSGQYVTIHGTQRHIGTRFYLHARNAADALLYILENCPPEMYPQANRPTRFNIVGERRIDNLTLASRIAEIVGEPLRYELVDFHATRPGHDMHYGLDGAALAAAGWKQPLTLDESLARTVEWTLTHPEWLIE